MPDVMFWALFIGAVIVLNLSPGPDMMYIVGRTLAQGPRIGVAAAVGVCTGALVHAAAAALGLSALIAASAHAFTVLKWVGAAYLVVLGIRQYRAASAPLASPAHRPAAPSAWAAFRDGVLIDVLNPKVALFFIAFLPQFVRADHGQPALQILQLGAVLVAVSLVIECSIALVAARAARSLAGSPRVSTWISRALGGVLVALGLRLALTSPR